jgi:hypothetical protein
MAAGAGGFMGEPVGTATSCTGGPQGVSRRMVLTCDGPAFRTMQGKPQV